MLIKTAHLVCPPIREGATPLTLDISEILVSEQRQDEIAIVSKAKAPELLAEFNRSWRELSKMIAMLSSEKNHAQKAVDKRVAVLQLEEVPGLLKEKGLSSTADTRAAVITLDPERERLQDIVDQMDAIIELLKGKLKSFENAFTSVKKIMGEDSFMSNARNPNLSGTTYKPNPGF